MIYLLVGVPSSGKTWVCNQIKANYNFIPHDDYLKGGYIEAIVKEIPSDKPLLIEAPFSISQTTTPLEAVGHKVTQVFIIEPEDTLKERYMAREGRNIPPQHMTRQKTYLKRAIEGGHFYGTSSQVLEHLRAVSS